MYSKDIQQINLNFTFPTPAQFVKSDKALKLGLVDEVVPMDQVMTAAKKQVTKFLEIPDVGRSIVKEGLRKADIEEFNEREKAMLDSMPA
ncbi:putative enoyl-CoA delta isomerase 1, mitochondrial [Apostichopus japonicus]|uniref:Putative enoyl-CoA delta isomerase 1, mitochondrial n=1 Tax=Stichopus japonicus TaxID=307972 RepID=A0A2G8LJH3_STIJA|nr:putative enoyl-CoA delta isomerase 1, mitochondrial [Apostichopus japonicus]